MGCSSKTSKLILCTISFLFWGAAAGLIFTGAWVYRTYNHFDELTRANLTLIPAAIAIAVGVFLFILGCIGCIAAFKENRCLLACFFAVLLIILTAEVTAAVLGYVFRKDVSNAVKDGLNNAMDNYNITGTQRDQVDYLQKELKCCGLNNYTDWETTPWGKSHLKKVPKSCCKQPTQNCSAEIKHPDEIYANEGCFKKLEDKFLKNLAYVAAVAIAFAVLQVLGMICSCILMCRSKELIPYSALGGPNSGLRV